MINRTLLRTKVVQVLYSMYVKRNLDLVMAESEIAVSARKSYDLYNYVLLLLVEVHRAACVRNDMINNRMGDLRGAEAIDERFIRNRFILQLGSNRELMSRVNEAGLSWAEHQDVVRSVLNGVLGSDYYREYVGSEVDDYGCDRELWRKVVKRELSDCELLESAVEDENVYWLNGLDLILEFVLKTIKMFDEGMGEEQGLLPMFDEEKGEGLRYATDLIDNVLLNSEATDGQITGYLKNWDLERLPLMDRVIMKCAIGEMTLYANTPCGIVINEYVEIAKYFSSPKSAKFINGVLDRVATEMRKFGV